MTAQEIEEWFKGRELPKESVWIHKSTKIINPQIFVENRLYSLRENTDPRLRRSDIDKLVKFKEWLEANGYG